MENQNQAFSLPEEALDKTTSVGCLQFFPIFFLLLIALTGLILHTASMVDEDGNRLLYDNEGWIVIVFLFISLVGLVLGIISSIFFFYARNKSNIASMKKGMILNIVAWIIYTICLLISITFI
ncbi:MAG: heme/copper-type cytochrome/quinol oxidase subunit 2 [Maribacter sp.]|jgi:heme/copper-type cytochrome/quinol oxidase subunit 2